MEELAEKLGVAPENIYHGYALQYTIEFLQSQSEEEEEEYEDEEFEEIEE